MKLKLNIIRCTVKSQIRPNASRENSRHAVSWLDLQDSSLWRLDRHTPISLQHESETERAVSVYWMCDRELPTAQTNIQTLELMCVRV